MTGVILRTKPCLREGCGSLVVERFKQGDKRWAKRKYCRNRCAWEVRQAQGGNFQGVSSAQRREWGRKGGVAHGKVSQRIALIEWAEKLIDLVPVSMWQALGPKDMARLKVVLVRAGRRGYLRGMKTAQRHQQRRSRERRAA